MCYRCGMAREVKDNYSICVSSLRDLLCSFAIVNLPKSRTWRHGDLTFKKFLPKNRLLGWAIRLYQRDRLCIFAIVVLPVCRPYRDLGFYFSRIFTHVPYPKARADFSSDCWLHPHTVLNGTGGLIKIKYVYQSNALKSCPIRDKIWVEIRIPLQ